MEIPFSLGFICLASLSRLVYRHWGYLLVIVGNPQASAALVVAFLRRSTFLTNGLGTAAADKIRPDWS